MSAMIDVHHLTKQYDPPKGVVAVNDISFTVADGEIFSLLGPNGAGKTTTISMLSGLLHSSDGDALIAGHSVRRNPLAVKRVIGVVPQEIALYEELTARQNLLFWGRMYDLGGRALRARVEEMLELVGLRERADDQVSTYSGGMKRRLNIAVGLLHRPAVLFLDEPTVGIDPQSRRRILDMVKELNQEGMTVLYTTHYMEEAEELSHRIAIMDQGEIIALGPLDDLIRLVGEHDTVRLTVVAAVFPSGLTDALTKLPGVSQVMAQGENLLLEVTDANVVLPDIVRVVQGSGVRVRTVRVERADLEAVFLHLTGRALRD